MYIAWPKKKEKSKTEDVLGKDKQNLEKGKNEIQNSRD